MAKPVFIYCLKDPTTGDVRYIGQTNNLKRRLKEHLKNPLKKKGHLGNWLRSLKGEKPLLAVLHEVAEHEDWVEEECRYIFLARGMGVDLVNATDGGEGRCGPLSPEHRAKAVAQCAAMSAANTGVPRGPHSPETRAAMSAALTGVPTGPCSPERRAAISASKMGVPNSPEHCAAMSASRKGVPWTPAQRAAHERGRSAKSPAK